MGLFEGLSEVAARTTGGVPVHRLDRATLVALVAGQLAAGLVTGGDGLGLSQLDVVRIVGKSMDIVQASQEAAQRLPT